MIPAFELWKLKRSRRKTIETYQKAIAKCKAEKTKTKDDLDMFTPKKALKFNWPMMLWIHMFQTCWERKRVSVMLKHGLQ